MSSKHGFGKHGKPQTIDAILDAVAEKVESIYRMTTCMDYTCMHNLFLL